MMTISEKINRINKDFYQTIASSFSQTRQYSWGGWDKLDEKKYIPKTSTLKVLDLGCGNGRFAHFVAKNHLKKVNYTGIDSSEELLKLASHQLKGAAYKNLEFNLHKNDLLDIKDNVLSSNYNLIALFGVMHHIYSEADRNNLFSLISKHLHLNGYFIFATWEFARNHRQLKKRLKLTSPDGKRLLNKYNLELLDFKEQDYILDWTRINTSYRYCRDYSTKELEILTEKNNLQIVDSFFADGKEGNVNKYYICKLVS